MRLLIRIIGTAVIGSMIGRLILKRTSNPEGVEKLMVEVMPKVMDKAFEKLAPAKRHKRCWPTSMRRSPGWKRSTARAPRTPTSRGSTRKMGGSGSWVPAPGPEGEEGCVRGRWSYDVTHASGGNGRREVERWLF